MTLRSQHELEHGRYLAAGGAEEIWGWGTPAGQVRAKRRADYIARGANLQPGMRVLEIGCGTGLFTELLAGAGATIVACDISPELLDIARRRGLDPAQVQFICKRFEDWDESDPFDAVVGSSVLHHLEVKQSLQVIRKLLRSGGRMSFAEPNMLNPQIAVQKNVPFIKRRLGDSPDETAFLRWRLKRDLAAAGFVDIVIEPFDFLHPATPPPLIPLMRGIGHVAEHVPLLRQIAGSLHFQAAAP